MISIEGTKYLRAAEGFRYPDAQAVARFASLGDVVTTELNDLAITIVQEAANRFFAAQIFPVMAIDATKREGSFKIWATADQDVDARRATGVTPNRVITTTNSVSYKMVDYALEYLIDDDVEAALPDERRMGILTVMDEMLIARELDVKAKVATAGNYNSDHQITAAFTWSDYVDGDPQGDIDNTKQIIAKAINREPNTLIIGPNVFDDLVRHPQLVGADNRSNVNVLTEADIAHTLRIERLWVPRATYNSAAQGQTREGANIWDDVAVLAFIPDSPSRNTPAFGLTLSTRTLGAYTGVQHSEFLDFVGMRESRDEVFAAVDTSDKAIAGALIQSVV